jgi:beta-lactam-binding protein with PASTA domain
MNFFSRFRQTNWRAYTDWHRYAAKIKNINWRRIFDWHTYVDWFKSVNWRRVFSWRTYADWFRSIPWSDYRDRIINGLENVQANGRSLIVAVVGALFLMFVTCLAVFFIAVKGQEKVMVPNVTGKELTEALLEMQVKELYPKIQLRYSDTPGDANKILEQSPEAGSIVKAGRRITLVVSRGVVIDHVENYVGMNFDDVKIKLQTLFAGTATPLIILADPVYKPDSSAAGTVLAQDPPEGVRITKPVRVSLVVSRGPETDKTAVPNIVGKSVNDILQLMPQSKIIFDFTQHTAAATEKPGTVVSQQMFGSNIVPDYTRMTADFAMPTQSPDGNVYGLFTDTLTEYPYPVAVKLEALPQEGNPYTIVSFTHPGGNLTIPYAVPRGTTLVLTVVGRTSKKMTVQ